MWQRLKNLWAWSAYSPRDFEQDASDLTSGTVTAERLLAAHHTVEEVKEMLDIGQEVTEIIYPDKRRELLRVKPEPSLDDLLKS